MVLKDKILEKPKWSIIRKESKFTRLTFALHLYVSTPYKGPLAYLKSFT